MTSAKTVPTPHLETAGTPGALRTWIGKASDRYPFPEYTPLDRCDRCLALVLTADLDAHRRWHRSRGDQ